MGRLTTLNFIYNQTAFMLTQLYSTVSLTNTNTHTQKHTLTQKHIQKHTHTHVCTPVPRCTHPLEALNIMMADRGVPAGIALSLFSPSLVRQTVGGGTSLPG